MDKMSYSNYLAFILGLAMAIPIAVVFFPATNSFYTALEELISSSVLKVVVAFALGLVGVIGVRSAGKKMSSIVIMPTIDSPRAWVTFWTSAIFGSLMYGGMIFVLLSAAVLIGKILEMFLSR